jgi:hypothetical protein
VTVLASMSLPSLSAGVVKGQHFFPVLCALSPWVSKHVCLSVGLCTVSGIFGAKEGKKNSEASLEKSTGGRIRWSLVPGLGLCSRKSSRRA